MRKRIDLARRVAPIAVAVALLIVPSLAMAQMMDTNSEVHQLNEWQGMHGVISSFSEAPMLASMVAAGDLPPLAERLPSNPLVVEPVDEVGQYGGVLRELRPEGTIINGDHWVWEYATAYSPDMSSIYPNALAGWEWSADGMTITLHLREGMKWSDGKPFVADDFLFYWNDIGLNEELFPTPPSQMRFAGEAGTISKVSDTAVQISWDVQAGMFVEFMARWRPANYAHSEFLKAFHPGHTSMDKVEAAVKEAGFETWTDHFKEIYNPQHSPKTPVIGPWKLENEKTDQVLVMNRNPYYWKIDTAGNQLPYIDAIHSQGVPPGEAELLKILAGESDLQAPGPWGGIANLQVVNENADSAGYRRIQYWWPGGEQGLIIFNFAHQDEVLRDLQSDKRFRIALSHAIDRDEINQTFYKGLGVASQPTVEAGPPYYGENLFKIYLEHDLDKANGILDELGLDKRDGDGYRLRSDGERLRMQIYAMPSGLTAEIADLYTGYWGDIGIETVARAGSWDAFGGIYNTNDFDLIMFPFGLAGRPMNPLIRGEVVPVGTWFTPGREWAAWLNTDGAEGMEPPDELKQIAALRERAISSADEAERIAITMEIFSLLEEGLYMIGAVRPPRQDYYGIASLKLGNVPDPIIAEHIHEVPAQFYFKS